MSSECFLPQPYVQGLGRRHPILKPEKQYETCGLCTSMNADEWLLNP